MLDVDGPLPRDMLRALPAIRRDPLAFLASCVHRYGDLVAFPLPRTPVLLVNTPAGAERVLRERPRAWSKATVQYGSLSAVTGAGLLTADGELWRRRRRVAQPAFHHGTLDVVARQAVAAADRVAAVWADLPDGAVVDVDAACLRATLEVVGGTLFDADLGERGDAVVEAVDDALQVVVARARSPLSAATWVPTPTNLRLRRAVAVLDDTVLAVVRERRARGVRDQDRDLLALLLRSAEAEGGLTDREVRDELVTLVIAGHETVASALTWTLHLLSRDPSAQARLHRELDEVLGVDAGDGEASRDARRAPRWGDLSRLRWTRAVVDEGLRLYPPAWVLTRRAEEPDVVDGVAVPAGTLAVVSPWLLHRRPQAWPDPERFDPGRFLPERSAAPRGDYLPFGVGPRLCIGRDFAVVEAVLVLAALLRDHVVEPVPGPPPAVEALVTLRPRGGMPLVLRLR